MAEATLSSKYQLVIPKEIREELHLEKKQKITIVAKDGIINLIPYQPLSGLKGFLKGMKTGKLRKEEDRT